MKKYRQSSDVAELVSAEQKQIVLLAAQASDLWELQHLINHLAERSGHRTNLAHTWISLLSRLGACTSGWRRWKSDRPRVTSVSAALSFQINISNLIQSSSSNCKRTRSHFSDAFQNKVLFTCARSMPNYTSRTRAFRTFRQNQQTTMF